MKKIFYCILLLCMMTSCTQKTSKLPDGIYLVESLTNDSTAITETGVNRVGVHFNKMFTDSAPDSNGLIVRTDNFVRLELDTIPEIVQQTDMKKKLQLSFSRVAADQLREFTARNVMRQAALIVDGEALTVHKIREAITGGKMEVTSRDDNSFEHLKITLKKGVKK